MVIEIIVILCPVLSFRLMAGLLLFWGDFQPLHSLGWEACIEGVNFWNFNYNYTEVERKLFAK